MLSPTVLTQPHSQCCAFACCVFRNILINRFFFFNKNFFSLLLVTNVKRNIPLEDSCYVSRQIKKSSTLEFTWGKLSTPWMTGASFEWYRLWAAALLLTFLCGMKARRLLCVWQLCTFLLFLKKIFTFRTMENHKTKTGLLGRIFLYFRIYILKFIFIYSISTYIHICINIYTNMYTYIHITTLILTN